ncbi:RDD family protein [Oscillatoriales cyanobacterium LEGE 11467]|uniref:RDD family protein n=2 Tax=Zarconia TaxID=2992130 RepID=A0A928VY75_9CYAN|nr:RDD family protein [Zarconia navalis LEGE 11467]
MDYDDALTSSVPSRAPKIPLGRRGWAFATDVFAASFLSALLGGGTFSLAGAISFLIVWFGLRAIVPLRNRGQSPGRWAFDLKLIDERYQGLPSFAELSKREAIAGFGAWLAVTGLANLGPLTGMYVLLLVPLGIDCGIAFADPAEQLAFHDRASGTRIVGSRRGYSLDLKVKKWVAIIRQRVKQ